MSMRKTIIRAITSTTIKSCVLKFEKGKPVMTENPDIIINGKIEEGKALKEVRKKYGEMAQVTEIVETTNTYEISVEDFIKNAKIVPADTKEETGEPTADEKPNEKEVKNGERKSN